MNDARFEEHLQDPSPGFYCFNCSDKSETADFLARVSHRVNPPAGMRARCLLKMHLAATFESMRSFYKKHDGVLMYVDSQLTIWSGGKFHDAGIAFFPVREWRRQTKRMRELLSWSGWGEESLSDWMRHGIVFGEIPHSSNYLVMQTVGADAGKVFYSEHEEHETDVLAISFDELLGKIIESPAEFLDRIGDFARYSDGKTDIQWIPKRYVADTQK